MKTHVYCRHLKISVAALNWLWFSVSFTVKSYRNKTIESSVVVLWCFSCEEYEAYNGSADTAGDGEHNSQSLDDYNDVEDDDLLSELNKAEIDEALEKNAEVQHYQCSSVP